MVKTINKKDFDKDLETVKSSMKLPVYNGGNNKNIEEQDWFHAMRPRSDIQNLVKNEGDWLVRVTDTRGLYELVITARGPKSKLFNYTVGVCNIKGFYLNILLKTKNVKYFTNIVDLVENYRDKILPGRVILKNPISKPVWLIKKTQIDYDMKNCEIGRGNFAIVYKGTFTNNGNQIIDVAIKVAITDASDKVNIKNAKDDLLKEAKIMSFLVHDNIVHFYGIACDKPPVILVMEFCPGGALSSHLKREENNICNLEKILYAYEICRGCTFLHSKEIIHRDLAARNCLISQDGIIKISDFGLSKMSTELKYESFWSQKIPLAWMAPETLVHNPVYSEKSDVWSFAVVLFEIYSYGNKPWPDMEPKKMATLIRKIKLWDMPSGTPKFVLDIVSRIFKADPTIRPDFKELTNIFKNYVNENKLSSSVKNLTINKIKDVKRKKYFTNIDDRGNLSSLCNINPKLISKENDEDGNVSCTFKH
ncbi:Tyrosine-protein kinase Fps85D [Strongyloides ratti]|uniref:Tyrosine-protein kinase n=1 Tax=Strongyloides ratti TaxID=34506 RepID=A0A090LIN6_STRRB|nr:Tyrosine-protein kinase Fps85D [Strongyloides ratti]CEF67355.1 Tyrosine-protein kinase Fps85D [Strongyloides ratti]